MSEAPDRDQKTESPTPKKLSDAKRDGDVLQSRELGTALIMVVGAAWLMMAGPWFVSQCLAIVREGLTISADDARAFDPATTAIRLGAFAILPLASLLAICLVAAIAGPAVLGSMGFRGKAMAFKASRINPVAGLGRMFGTHGLTELAKALAKVALLGLVGYWLLTNHMSFVTGLSAAEIAPAAGVIGKKLVFAVFALSLGLVAIAGIDVPIQMIRRNARLRMTKQEVKEEMRQSEGSPELKQALRQRQHAVLMGSARRAVSEATVILTNPTHFAVALRYRPGIDAAPMVVARGRGETALAIRELAKDKAVPTLEYPQLARAIYFTARAGQTIAEDLYLAVATILAFVFNIEQALAEGIAPPAVTVPDDKRFDEEGRRPG